MSKEAGHEMSVEQIKEKLAKMPEWIKMGEMWKAKMAAGGGCGKGGMMAECMKKMMAGGCKEGNMGGMMGEMAKKFMEAKMGGCGSSEIDPSKRNRPSRPKNRKPKSPNERAAEK